jgi:hypothetical protein
LEAKVTFDPFLGTKRDVEMTSIEFDPVFTRSPLKYRAPPFDSRKFDPTALIPSVVSPNTIVVG